jgi:hypothetical protein
MFAASVDNVSNCEIFRTYRSPQSSINCTLIDALCASLAILPLFDPVPIGPRLRERRFIGGSLGFYNPTREMLKEAKVAFGHEQRVALILSLGSGVPSIVSLDSSFPPFCDMESLVKYIGTDCERVAREMGTQLISLDAYVRLNVSQGLEDVRFDDWSCIGLVEGYIKTYLEAASVTRAVDLVSEKIMGRIGSITVGQLSMFSNPVISLVLVTNSLLDCSTRIKHMAKPVPSVSPYYVARQDEWKIMNRHLVINLQDKMKIFTVTGMGGCGKTQMVAYFVERYRSR